MILFAMKVWRHAGRTHGALPGRRRTLDNKFILEMNHIEKDFFGRTETPFELVTRKAAVPSAGELERNPRSRSARLRAAVKR